MIHIMQNLKRQHSSADELYKSTVHRALQHENIKLELIALIARSKYVCILRADVKRPDIFGNVLNTQVEGFQNPSHGT